MMGPSAVGRLLLERWIPISLLSSSSPENSDTVRFRRIRSTTTRQSPERERAWSSGSVEHCADCMLVCDDDLGLLDSDGKTALL